MILNLFKKKFYKTKINVLKSKPNSYIISEEFIIKKKKMIIFLYLKIILSIKWDFYSQQ